MGGPGSDGRLGDGRLGGMGRMGGGGLDALLGAFDSFGKSVSNGATASTGMFGPGFFNPGGRYDARSEGSEDKSGVNDGSDQDTGSTTPTGSWSGMGISGRFSDEGSST
jgi:hypothetical protein